MQTRKCHTHMFMTVFTCCRKEERKARLRFQQAVTQDERVLALQKKLEDKKHERQRIKQTESKKAKTSEPAAAHTLRHTEKHDRVSMKSSLVISVCFC